MISQHSSWRWPGLQAEIDGEEDWEEESYIEIGFESDAFQTGSSDSYGGSLRKQWLHRPVAGTE